MENDDSSAKYPWLEYLEEIEHANRFAIQPEFMGEVQDQLFQAAKEADASGDDPRAAIRKKMEACLNEYWAEHDAQHNRRGREDDVIDWE